jgi:hypothetical protein
VLKKELEDRIADLGKPGSWPEILTDLDSLTETEVEQDNKRFVLRSAPRPAAAHSEQRLTRIQRALNAGSSDRGGYPIHTTIEPQSLISTI